MLSCMLMHSIATFILKSESLTVQPSHLHMSTVGHRYMSRAEHAQVSLTIVAKWFFKVNCQIIESPFYSNTIVNFRMFLDNCKCRFKDNSTDNIQMDKMYRQ